MVASTPTPAQTAENINGLPATATAIAIATDAATKSGKEKVSYASLPKKKQLAILCLARLADPLASTSINSYLFYQLQWFNSSLSDAEIATQAGLLVGAKTAAQVCSGLVWGRIADSSSGGRKAVLLVGLTCSGI